MSEKILSSRIVHKHDVEANWLKAVNFIPKQGEIIVYDSDGTYNYERIKIGDGETLVSALPFVDDAAKESIAALNTTIGDVDSKVDAVSTLVGDTAVATQISNAVKGTAPNPIQLTGGDLNNVRTPGHYFAGGSSGVANIPTGVDAFGVEVYRSAGGYITQELTSGNQLIGKKFMRIYNNSTWSEWEVIYTSAYPQVHVGPTQPTDPNVQVWINTAEEGTGVVPVLPRIATISLPAASWTGSSEPYSQVVEINTVTTATKVDLQPSAQQIVSLQSSETTLMIENNGGVVTCHAIGNKPTVDYTMQVLLQEVAYV